MYSSRSKSSAGNSSSFRLRRRSTGSGDQVAEEDAEPLLSPSETTFVRRRTEDDAKTMGFFDNLRKWDKVKAYRWAILFALSLSGDGWSYEAGVIASIFQLPSWVAHMGYPGEYSLPDWQNQWVGPVYSLGQLSGGLFAAFVLDTYGRKPTLTIGALCMELSTALLVWSPSFGVVVAARVIEGISIGFLLLGYQIYAVEVAAKEDRGFVSSFSLITGNFFGLLAAGIIYGITYDHTNTGWRAALSITFIPATILLIALPWVPESPRFLFQHNRHLECEQVLAKLYGGNITPTGSVDLSEQALVEYEAMQAAITWDLEHKQHKWSSLWDTKAARYRSFVAFSSQSWWAWNGQSVFTYYYSKVFRAAGITSTHLIFGITAIQNASWCIASPIGGYLLDVWGRRTNYLIGVGQACICLIIQGSITLSIFDKGETNHAAGSAFVSIYLIQWFFWLMFYSPVVNILPAEVYSAGLRARGYAIANIFSMAVGFATQYSALPMYETMKGWTWIFFAGCMAFAFVIIFLFYPETKGITLEEIEVVFGTGAGTLVKQALGRRRSLSVDEGIEHVGSGGSDDDDKHAEVTTLNAIPKIMQRHVPLTEGQRGDV